MPVLKKTAFTGTITWLGVWLINRRCWSAGRNPRFTPAWPGWRARFMAA